MVAEDVVDGDEHLSSDCDQSFVVSSAFHDSHLELVESWVVSRRVLVMGPISLMRNIVL